MLMNQLKVRNPQMFQVINQARQNKDINPQKIATDMIKDYSPEKLQQFREFANGFGITNEQLDDFGIKAK